MIRHPIVSGMFYEGTKDELNKQIENSFLSEFGPKSLPMKSAQRKIRGAIIPHAGYMFSGACAAHAYKAIAESEWPELFLIIGPNHTGLGTSSISLSDFETPLGIARTDHEFASLLAKNSGLKTDEAAHSQEHSAEVQIPFLQYIAEERTLRIAAVSLDSVDYAKFGKAISTTIKESGKKVIIIASSDFTHYGIHYNFVPFFDNIKDQLTKLDQNAFSFVEKADAKGFVQNADETGATICGRYAIAALILALKPYKLTKLCHYSSGDIVHDYSSCVDYISAVLE